MVLGFWGGCFLWLVGGCFGVGLFYYDLGEQTAPSVTVVAAVVTGSAAAANNDKGSVPSNTLLSGSITELEEEEEVDEVLPFRFIFLLLDSVT